MSDDTIDFLQKRLTTLEADNARLQAENKDRRIKHKTAAAELDKLRADLITVTKERDDHKTLAEQQPKDLTTKIATLEGQIRHRDHRDAFGQVKEFEVSAGDGKGLKKYRLADGVTPDAIWKQTGYVPEGETPDGKAVAARYGEALQAHPFLFAEATTGPGGSTQPFAMHARESGPGGGKGSISPTVAAATGDRYVTSGSTRPAGVI